MSSAPDDIEDTELMALVVFERVHGCTHAEALSYLVEGYLFKKEIDGMIYVAWKDPGKRAESLKLRKSVLGDDDDGPEISSGNKNISSGSSKFKIYKHPVLGHEVIKEGFSWPGFFFTWIWAFLKKLWAQGGTLVIVVFVANTLGIALFTGRNSALDLSRGDHWANLILSLMLLFGPGIYVGLKGNSWREKSMAQRGFDLVGSVDADTTDGALAKVKELTTVQSQ